MNLHKGTREDVVGVAEAGGSETQEGKRGGKGLHCAGRALSYT